MNRLKLILAALMTSRTAFQDMSAKVPDDVKPEFEKMTKALNESINQIETAKDPTDDQLNELVIGAVSAQSKSLAQLNGVTASIAALATKAFDDLKTATVALNGLPKAVEDAIAERKLLTPAQAEVLKSQAVEKALADERAAVEANGKRLAAFNSAIPGAPAPTKEFLAGSDEDFGKRLEVAKANAEALTKRGTLLNSPAGVMVFHSAEKFAADMAIVDAVANGGKGSGAGSGGGAHPLGGCGAGAAKADGNDGLVG